MEEEKKVKKFVYYGAAIKNDYDTLIANDKVINVKLNPDKLILIDDQRSVNFNIECTLSNNDNVLKSFTIANKLTKDAISFSFNDLNMYFAKDENINTCLNSGNVKDLKFTFSTNETTPEDATLVNNPVLEQNISDFKGIDFIFDFGNQ